MFYGVLKSNYRNTCRHSPNIHHVCWENVCMCFCNCTVASTVVVRSWNKMSILSLYNYNGKISRILQACIASILPCCHAIQWIQYLNTQVWPDHNLDRMFLTTVEGKQQVWLIQSCWIQLDWTLTMFTICFFSPWTLKRKKPWSLRFRLRTRQGWVAPRLAGSPFP